MIICSCTVMTRDQLSATVRALLAEDPQMIVTPGRAFHRLGLRMQCARCATLVNEKIAEEVRRPRPDTPPPRP
ncbi:(2Fe-2S)-binding protein [Actibacterium sp.]|uniref:(2Fe-2S)-binding protein n=1 Tax=Actibacterium sp. TaxID=1872125 RepID=UPI00257A8BC7|nr:(2Fe-2S)-binding protein [Actibacterium sp.]